MQRSNSGTARRSRQPSAGLPVDVADRSGSRFCPAGGDTRHPPPSPASCGLRQSPPRAEPGQPGGCKPRSPCSAGRRPEGGRVKPRGAESAPSRPPKKPRPGETTTTKIDGSAIRRHIHNQRPLELRGTQPLRIRRRRNTRKGTHTRRPVSSKRKIASDSIDRTQMAFAPVPGPSSGIVDGTATIDPVVP